MQRLNPGFTLSESSGLHSSNISVKSVLAASTAPPISVKRGCDQTKTIWAWMDAGMPPFECLR